MKCFIAEISLRPLLLLLLSSSVASAQATVALNGRVTDESGAVLPGVTVSATQTDTGLTRTVATDATGTYVMPNMAPGPYRLEVTLQGFRTYVQTGIVLQVGGTPTINAALAVGNLEETVSVEASAPLVDVRSAGLSDVVENERIVALPLQGRQVTDLIVLAGAAVQTGTADRRSMSGGVSISVAGGLSFGVGYTLDGATHNNPQDNMNLPFPFPDALQEFSVATSGLSAQSGFHSGASVNAVTKSGTNTLHGNAFEFLRDRRFNATQVFAGVGPDGEKQDDGLNRNQYGGTLGGRIVRDKAFFFGGYQGTRVRQIPADNIANVPTAAMLAGDFTAFASQACNGGRQIALRAPFVNNQVNPALFSPAALNLAGRLPSTTDPCGRVTYRQGNDRDEWQAMGRVDYQVIDNHSVFGRYMATSSVKPSPFATSGNILTLSSDGIGLDNMAHSATAGHTVILGTNTVNALRVALNRTSVLRNNPPYFQASDLGVKLFNYSSNREMRVTVTGGFGISETSGTARTEAYQVSDDLTLVRGNHQLSLGANVAFWKMDFLTHARSGGQFTFSGEATGLGLADLLVGRVSRLEHGGPSVLPMQQLYLGLYTHDTWRAGSRVTLNAGLRWEPFFGQKVLNGVVNNFSLDDFRAGVRSTVYRFAPAGMIYPGDPGSPGLTGMNTQWWNLSPRVGVAWDVKGDGRMAVRSSYGLAYDFPTGEYHNVNASAPPFANRMQVADPPGLFDDPYGHLGGDPHPIVTSPDTIYPPFGGFGAFNPEMNSPRIQTWNVTLERQLWAVWQVSASYLGSYSDRLWGLISLNPGVYMGLGPCAIQGVSYPVCTTNANLDRRRVLYLENPQEAQFIGALDFHDNVGEQTYRGLKLSFQRRAATGVSVNGNYTWSRCFGDRTPGGFSVSGTGFTNPANPAFDRGHCDQDRTHLASFTVGAQTPQFTSLALRALASDWRVSGILIAQSGSWLTVTTGRDNAFNGITNQRVNQVSDDVYGAKTLTNYLNRAAFEQPANGTFGDHERNSIKGPGFWTIDAALSRRVSSIGAQSLEFRIEAFNLLNHFNWGNPDANFGSGLFGLIRSQAGNSRILQFGVKYGF